MKKNFAMMAFAKGKESTEAVVAPKYWGIAPVFVVAVNPNKAKLEEIFGRELEDEPTYTGEVEVDGKKYANARISFIIKTDAEKCGIDTTTNITFFIQNRYRQGSQSGKYQIIDKYGRTAWATKEDIEAKKIPTYSNGPANIDADYRPAYVGEEELTNFIKNYLNIPNVQVYNSKNKTWSANTAVSPEECEARLESIKDFFNGKFNELNEIISLQPKNKVKVLFGIKTNDKNQQFQTVYSHFTAKNNVTDFTKMADDVQAKKDAGGLKDTEFRFGDLEEYSVEATQVAEAPTEKTPFDEGSSENAPW